MSSPLLLQATPQGAVNSTHLPNLSGASSHFLRATASRMDGMATTGARDMLSAYTSAEHPPLAFMARAPRLVLAINAPSA